MKIRKRFIASVVRTARTPHHPLPFERGEPRAHRIARRDAPALKAAPRQA